MLLYPGVTLKTLLHSVTFLWYHNLNLAAIGECQFGCAQGHRNIMYLFVGRGFGAGLVLGGNLFRGGSQVAGEVGNMVIDRTHLYQGFGTRGCQTPGNAPGTA